MELTTLFAGYTAAEGKAERTKTARQDDRCGISDTVGQLKECEYLLRKNETLFNMEDEEEMIDCRIYEREALLARYQYLLRQIRAQRAAERIRQAQTEQWKGKSILKRLLPGRGSA